MLAGIVVLVELLLIALIRHRYMDTPLLAATFQVVVGGVLVFLAGILLAVLATISFATGDIRAGSVMSLMIAIGVGLKLIQEAKADRAGAGGE